MSASKSIIRSPIPPTSHSLSSYSKFVSFDSLEVEAPDDEDEDVVDDDDEDSDDDEVFCN